jgi:hypothetical protein
MNVYGVSGTGVRLLEFRKVGYLVEYTTQTTFTSSSAFGTGMGRTLGSALTLSTIGLGSKLVVKWLAKKFDVRGLPILLNALKEPDLELSWKKDKGKLVDNVQEKPKLKRRGIVTSE